MSWKAASAGGLFHLPIGSPNGRYWTIVDIIGFEMAVICYFESGGSDLDTITVRSFSAFKIVFVGAM